MDIYNVNKYTDEQLYEILDMNNPTDRELEAKIIQVMNKYDNSPSDIGKQLYTFFDNIYKRFFSTDSDDEIEGFTDEVQVATTSPEEKAINQTDNLSYVQQIPYSADKLQLNPLLKQTIKRVISIDSQYRNISTYPNTTNFSFDLSEPLRDVVSLKLYSIQIPYTWYTVAKSFGSNFFLLYGNSPGIENQIYKIEIKAGNYDQTTLPLAINTAFEDISNNSGSEINFNGLPLIDYDSVTAKTTIQLDIQNTFNDTYYDVTFPFFRYPIDISQNQTKSIAGFLGFNNPTYSINAITSLKTYITTSTITTQLSLDYILDDSNNYFTIVQYKPYSPFLSYNSNSVILNTIKIQLLNQDGLPFVGQATRQNIIDSLNNVFMKSGYFDTATSKVQRIDVTNVSNINYGYSYFSLNISLNRNTIKYVPNSKIVIIFPDETPKINAYNEVFTIWKYQPNIDYSCFFFENSTNQFSYINSESELIQSSFSVDSSTNIVMTCKTPGLITTLNDFSMNVQTGTYNLNGFLNAINRSFQDKNTPSDEFFNMTNTNAFIDNDEVFNLSIDLAKSFRNINYKAIIDNRSFLDLSNNFDISYDIVRIPNRNTTNLFDISYINIRLEKRFGGYGLDSSCVLIVESDTTYENKGNANTAPTFVLLNSLVYSTYQSFIQSIQNAFITTSVTTNVNTQTPLIQTVVTYNDANNNYIDISLNLSYHYYLTEANYDVSFIDNPYDITSPQNTWHRFNIYSNYDISTNTVTGIANIKGYDSLSSELLQSLTLYDNCNNTIEINTSNANVPSDNITIELTPGTYSTATIITEINRVLSLNPKTYGSHFETVTINTNEIYTRIWLNINRIYTTNDYNIIFYDPINFVSCYSGSKSVQNTTWDSTIGWILGFRYYTVYNLTKENQTVNVSESETEYYYKDSKTGSYIIDEVIDPSSNLLTSTKIRLTGDTSLSTNLYNYFMISLDDYIQNHLNDGLVTITRSQTSIEIPEYSYTSTQSCDPATNELVSVPTRQPDSNNVTNAQLYSLNQSAVSQQNTSKEYSPGPFIKDLFGIIPIKPPAKTGDYYTEFGGTLQNQERLYFGPVNIRKMTIQLLTDRGTIIDLNNSNWTFSFICEQLYRSTST